jgi:RimJ/RimL family protein N-acetyltransferase
MSQVKCSQDETIAEQAWYGGSGAHAFACLSESHIVGLCYFWFAERYRNRNYWPLAEGEAKLVQIFTIPEMRGRGLATELIGYASGELFRLGFRRLYARVWHSNTPSSRAFIRAGWKRVATIIEVNPLRRETPFRITLAARRQVT